jgi:hypothetical protein
MKTIVAGSRSIVGITALLFLNARIRDLPWTITEVVSGTARGIDRMGEDWARNKGVPIKRMPAVWYPDGPSGGLDRAAGFYRNAEMAEYADALLAIWDGQSRGTEHMIRCMRGAGKIVVVCRFIGDGLDC